MIAAFETGDPQQAFAASGEVGRLLLEVEEEAARLRFKVNFATPVCDRCEGLTVGPGVAATCFQVKRCRYTNVKDDELPRLR